MSSITRERPSLDQWLKEAKAEETAGTADGRDLLRESVAQLRASAAR